MMVFRRKATIDRMFVLSLAKILPLPRFVLGLVMIGSLTAPIAARADRPVGKAYQYDADMAEQRAAASGGSTLTQTEKQEILSLIDAARATARKCGTKDYPAVSALSWDTRLESAAQRHSNDMATRNFFSHTGSDGSTPSSRVSVAGYSWRFIGENIAAGYTTPQSVINGWLRSSGHCANIMTSRAQDVGVAKAVNASSRYGVYWTLDVAAPR